MARLGDVTPADPTSSGDGLVGAVLDGRYRLDALLGRGGAGTVYRAVDLRLDRDVAVKVLNGAGGLDDGATVVGPAGSSATEGERRVAAEVRTLARFSHPNLVRLLDAGELDGRACLVMDLVDGPTLARRLASGPLGEQVAARVGAEIASALAYVHAEGIVHRDVKPANVLIGGDGVARLADFGIARLVDTTGLTATGYVLGTPAYLAPEQILGGTVGQPVDVYSLGLVLIECLTGRRAFEGTVAELTAARLHRDPAVPPGVGADWSHLLRAMTARDPEQRPLAAIVANRLAALCRPGSSVAVGGDPLPTAGLGAAALEEPDPATVGLPTTGLAAAGSVTAAATATVRANGADDGPTLPVPVAGAAPGDPGRGADVPTRRIWPLALAGLVALAGLGVALAEALPGGGAAPARSGTLTGAVRDRRPPSVTRTPAGRARSTGTTAAGATTATTVAATTTSTTTTSTTSTTTTTTTAPVSPLVAAETDLTGVLASGVRAGTVSPAAQRQIEAALQGIGAATGPGGSSSTVAAFDQVVGTFYAAVDAGAVVGTSTTDAVLHGLSALAAALGTSVPPPSSFAGPGLAPGAPGQGGPGQGHGNGNGNGLGRGGPNGH